MVPLLAVSSILIGLLSPDIWFWAFTSLLVIPFIYFEIELFKWNKTVNQYIEVYKAVTNG